MGKGVEKENATELTGRARDLRQREFNDKFPVLDRQNFESDEAYRTALLDQYAAIRKEEYNIICEDVGMNMAAASAYYTKVGSKVDIWDGYKLLRGDSAQQLRENSGVAYVRQYSDGLGVGDDAPNANCAITSAVMVAEMSRKFGYDGEDNVVTAGDYRNRSAAEIHQSIKLDTQYGSTYGEKNRKDLNTLIAEGKVGPGSVLSFSSPGNVRNGGSGNHAKTLIAVQRDDAGKPISYVTMENNGKGFLNTYSIEYDRNGKPKPGKNKVAVTPTNQWADARIAEERNNLANSSVEEIQTAINQSRNRVVGEKGFLNELQVAEADMLSPQNTINGADVTRGRKMGTNRDKLDGWVDAYEVNLTKSSLNLKEVKIEPQFVDMTPKMEIKSLPLEELKPLDLENAEQPKKHSKIKVFFGKAGEKIKGVFKKKKKAKDAVESPEAPEVAPKVAEAPVMEPEVAPKVAEAPVMAARAPEAPEVAPKVADAPAIEPEAPVVAAARAPEAPAMTPEAPEVAPKVAEAPAIEPEAPDSRQETKSAMKSDAEVFFSFFMSVLLDDSKNRNNAAMEELLEMLAKAYAGNDNAEERAARLDKRTDERLPSARESVTVEKEPAEKATASFKGPVDPRVMHIWANGGR